MRPVGVVHLDVRWVSFGLPQVAAADHENANNSRAPRAPCVPGRRGALSSTGALLEADVLRDEVIGFYRGLWIPLVTISFVRAYDHFLGLEHPQTEFSGAASFTIYTETKDYFRAHNYLNRNSVFDAALVGGVGGAVSGSLISFGSARGCPRFLLKQHLNPPSVRARQSKTVHSSAIRVCNMFR